MVVNAVDIYCRKCGAMPGTACTQSRTKTGFVPRTPCRTRVSDARRTTREMGSRVR